MPIRNYYLLLNHLHVKEKDYIGDTDEMCDKREKWIEDIDLFEKNTGYKYYYMKEKTLLSTIIYGREEKDEDSYDIVQAHIIHDKKHLEKELRVLD